MSDVAGDLGCHYSDTLFRQTNVDRVSDIQGQEHRKVDCLQIINAKIPIGLLCTWNTEAYGVGVEVVCLNLLALKHLNGISKFGTIQFRL